MFDNLRDTGDSFIYEEDQNDLYKEPAAPSKPSARASSAPKRRKGKGKKFLGMTPQQRFILSVMLMALVCVMGAAALFVTGRIGF